MKKKTIALALALVMVFGATMGGTFAYLTSQDSVVNTFTVGKVAITLDEADVDMNGDEIKDAARVKTNEYKLMPGHEYTKDPTIRFQPNSEASYLFVKVENGIADIEAAAETTAAGYKPIATQITDNGWTALDNVAGVYYKKVDANTSTTAAVDYAVFAEFKISGDVQNAPENEADRVQGVKYIEDYATTLDDDGNPVENAVLINVTAYAVQADGMDDAADAWSKTFGAPATTEG